MPQNNLDFLDKYSCIFSTKEFNELKKYSSMPLRKAIRVNTSRISLEDFEKIAQKNEWILHKIPYIKNWYFIDREDKSKPLGKSLEYQAGYFYIQEASSMIPPEVLDPQPGDIILDMSAAPGSKTSQIANKLNWKWIIMANDIISARINSLITNIEYLGLINTVVSKLDWRDFGRYFYETFDKVLLDAPCSWEGTVRKEKIHWTQKWVERLSFLQKRLISSAIDCLKIWWELVYSTCTLSIEEDEEIVDFVAKNYEWIIEIIDWDLPWLITDKGTTSRKNINLSPECKKSHKIWPHLNNTEWFFIAKFRKISSSDGKNRIYYQSKSEEKILKWKNLKQFLSEINKRFSFERWIFDDYIFSINWSEIRIKPKWYLAFKWYPNIVRSGLLFAKKYNNDYVLSSYISQVFGRYAFKQKIYLSSINRAEDYRIGKDIILENTEINNSDIWQVIVFYEDMIIWIGNLDKNKKLKNKLPRKNIKT